MSACGLLLHWWCPVGCVALHCFPQTDILRSQSKKEDGHDPPKKALLGLSAIGVDDGSGRGVGVDDGGGGAPHNDQRKEYEK